MPLKKDGVTPKEWFPLCILPNLRKKITLNAVGLSGNGLKFLVDTGEWQKRTEPFWISFMSVAKTREGRLAEFRNLVGLLKTVVFLVPWGLQINLSCPNQSSLTEEEAVEEAGLIADILAELGVPIMFKLSVTTSPQQAKPIADHPHCDAICVSNTIPFGYTSDRIDIDWNDLFDIDPSITVSRETPELSPLFPQIGKPGGLSGPPLLPYVIEWVREARAIGIEKHLNAGGGIFHPKDVRSLKEAGANSVSIGTVAMYNPNQVRPIIKEAQKQFA